MGKQHETNSDLFNQRRVMVIIHEWLQKLPAIGSNGDGFKFEEIPTFAGQSTPDYTLWWNNLRVGVVEIKCRTSDYDTWMISRNKLKMLYNNHQKKGFPALLAFAVVDDSGVKHVYLQDLRVLVAKKDQWQNASSEMTNTTNHGKDKRSSKDDCHLLPRDLFWKIT